MNTIVATMIRTIVPSESGQRWRQLLHLHEQHVSNPLDVCRELTTGDPFDCEDLTIPPLPDTIEKILEEKVTEWENLDSRLMAHSCPSNENTSIAEESLSNVGEKVAPSKGRGRGSHNRKPKPIQKHTQVESVDDDDDSLGNRLTSLEEEDEEGGEGGDYAGIKWGWHANRIRLPDGFDFACRRAEPPSTPSHPHKKRRQVLNIEDPSGAPLEYEAELWKLFKSIPVEEDIEKSVMEGCLCKNSLEIKDEIEQGLKGYSRMDAHALGRLRKKERHAWPTGGGLSQIQSSLENNVHSNVDGVTIRVECWRRLLKRGSSSDSDRLEMEFCGEQTLLDLHNAIVECANDQLFTKGMMKEAISSQSRIESSGIFMIENTFYTTGDVDYCTLIKNWLDQDISGATNQKKKRRGGKHTSRYEYLGLSSNKISVKLMKDTRLDSLSFCLGVRYYYSFHGDCDISIFFTDVRARLKNERLQRRHYPLFHDIWTSPGPLSFCQGCEKAPASVVTIEDELTDGGPTYLCLSCHYRIHYTKDGSKLTYNNFRVFPHNIITFHKDFPLSNSSVDESF